MSRSIFDRNKPTRPVRERDEGPVALIPVNSAGAFILARNLTQFAKMVKSLDDDLKVFFSKRYGLVSAKDKTFKQEWSESDENFARAWDEWSARSKAFVHDAYIPDDVRSRMLNVMLVEFDWWRSQAESKDVKVTAVDYDDGKKKFPWKEVTAFSIAAAGLTFMLLDKPKPMPPRPVYMLGKNKKPPVLPPEDIEEVHSSDRGEEK
jgi:hypothetical protein